MYHNGDQPSSVRALRHEELLKAVNSSNFPKLGYYLAGVGIHTTSPTLVNTILDNTVIKQYQKLYGLRARLMDAVNPIALFKKL